MRILVLSALIASGLMACRLFFDFDDFDTSDPTKTAVQSPSPQVEAGTFELVAPDALTIAPGTSAQLAVSIRRHGVDGRVILSVPDVPAGLAPVLGAAIEPDTSNTILQLQALPSPGLATVPLRIQAVAGTEIETKDVLLTFRGPSCSLDIGFGNELTGLIHSRDQSDFSTEQDGIFLAIDRDQFVVASSSNGIDDFRELDPSSNASKWNHVFADPAVAAGDGDGGVYVASDALVVRIVNGELDRTFGTDGGLFARNVTSMTASDTKLNLLLADQDHWALEQVHGQDRALTRAPTTIDGGSLMPAKLASSDNGLFSCGTLTDLDASTRAAYSHWQADGAPDPSFGANDLASGDPNTTVIDCAADDGGVIAVGTQGESLAIFAVAPNGAIDRTFGDAGTAPVDGLAPVRILSAGNTLFVLTDGPANAKLTRYDRKTGALDPTFGTHGQCLLGPLGLASASEMALTADGKLLLLGSADGVAIIGRLWL
jgi:hypothetical protein